MSCLQAVRLAMVVYCLSAENWCYNEVVLVSKSTSSCRQGSQYRSVVVQRLKLLFCDCRDYAVLASLAYETVKLPTNASIQMRRRAVSPEDIAPIKGKVYVIHLDDQKLKMIESMDVTFRMLTADQLVNGFTHE
jgi:hypothetical protein